MCFSEYFGISIANCMTPDRVSTGASSAYITEEERANTDAKECLVIYKLSHFTQKSISSECYGCSL